MDRNIGFANCIPYISDDNKFRNTPYGQFLIGSPLSFHLNPIEHTTKVKTNIVTIDNPCYSEHEFKELPIR